MKLENLLSERRSVILEKWFDGILETYPTETASFLRKQKNRFTNPVAYQVRQGIEGLFQELLEGIDSEKVSTFLDRIIRVRAVQDFSPSQAVAFIFVLKKVIREELKSEIRENGLTEELLKFESKIDELILLSFDIYMKCREKVYELKVSETKRILYSLLRKANLMYEVQEQEPDVRRDH